MKRNCTFAYRMSKYFEYGDKETDYLRQKDKRLAEVIDRVEHIHRAVDGDLFSSVVHHIIGQQISTRAQQTVWRRMQERFGEVTAEAIESAMPEELQSLGMTFRKAEYIKDFCRRITSGDFDLQAVSQMSDAEAIAVLSSL